jgi:hypothetical protein
VREGRRGITGAGRREDGETVRKEEKGERRETEVERNKRCKGPVAPDVHPPEAKSHSSSHPLRRLAVTRMYRIHLRGLPIAKQGIWPAVVIIGVCPPEHLVSECARQRERAERDRDGESA